MKKLILIILLLFIHISVKAACRKDTIYKFTIENNISYPQKRIINQFNAQNIILESIEQEWNSTSKAYFNTFKIAYTYNNNGKLIETLQQVWSSNVWKNYSKQINTIDANGNITEYKSQNWISSWEDRTKIQYVNNSSNKLIRSITSNWNYYGKNTWDLRSKDSMVYDLTQNNIEKYHYAFDNSIKKWEPTTLLKYSYNIEKNVTSELELDWFNNKWDSLYRTKYTYKSNNQITQELLEKWDDTYGLFIASRTTFTYNSNDNISQKLLEDWNPIDKVWLNYYKETYTYDANENLISKSNFLSWDKTLNSFTLETKEDYKCSNILAIKSLNKSKLIIYPNPSKGLININSGIIDLQKPIQIYNAEGKLLAPSAGIETPLENGIYMVYFTFKTGEVKIEKLMVFK